MNARALLLSLGLFLCAAAGAALAQNSTTRIARTPLTDLAGTSSVFSVPTSAGVDTTTYFKLATNTSLAMKVHGTTPSVLVKVYVGLRRGPGLGDDQFVLDDTFTVASTGTHVKMIFAPVAPDAIVVFDGNASNGADVTIDSLEVLSQW